MRFPLLILAAILSFAINAQDPKKTAAVLTGDAKGSVAANPQCKLFTSAEAAKYIGLAVTKMSNAAVGSGCQWVGKDYDGDMLVQVVPESYHEMPKLAKGFKLLPNLGPKAFVVPEMGGWGAGAIQGKDSVRVTLAGPAASEQKAVELLTETLNRRK